MTYQPTRRLSSLVALATLAGGLSAFAQQPGPSISPNNPNPPASGQPAVSPAQPIGRSQLPGKLQELTPEQMEKLKVAQQGATNDVDPTARFPVDAANPASMVVFERAIAELGSIGDEKSVEFTFPFKNEGNKTLEFLGQPTGSCGCTVPNLEKLTYEPGESGLIKGSYNPNHRNGPQQTVVTVRTNDPKKPTIRLNVKSDVKPAFRADPQFVNLQQVDRKAGATANFRVISRQETLGVENVTPSSPRSKVKVLPVEVKQLEGGETVWETPIQVDIDTMAGTGQLNENLVIRSTSGPNGEVGKTISVSILGEVLGDITASPNQLSLNALTPNQAVNSAFQLVSRTGAPFKVLKVEEVSQSGAQPFMKFAATETAGAAQPTWNIAITGNAPANQGSLRGEIVVTTDNANDPQMRVRYFGFVRAVQTQQPAQAPAQRDPWAESPSLLETGPRGK